MIRIKPGVQFHHTSFMWPDIMRMVWVAQLEAPVGYEMTITSACDGKHMVNSAHYRGRAFDVRIRDLPPDEPKSWSERIQSMLGSGYFVLLERTHIHIQVIQ